MNNDQPTAPRKFLMAKALGFTNSITRLSSEERNQNPSKVYGEDYNRLRTSAGDKFPAIKEFLPPPAAVFDDGQFDGTAQMFGEILTWSEQIYQLLSSIEE